MGCPGRFRAVQQGQLHAVVLEPKGGKGRQATASFRSLQGDGFGQVAEIPFRYRRSFEFDIAGRGGLGHGLGGLSAQFFA